MINLQRFREHQARRYKCLALSIVCACYMLIGVPVWMYLPRMQAQRDRLSAIALKIKPNQQDTGKTTRSMVMAIHKLVWAKRHDILMLIRELIAIPADVALISVTCQEQVCEFKVGSNRIQQLMRVFAGNRLRDLKQGGCPLCYRAKIDVKLS